MSKSVRPAVISLPSAVPARLAFPTRARILRVTTHAWSLTACRPAKLPHELLKPCDEGRTVCKIQRILISSGNVAQFREWIYVQQSLEKVTICISLFRSNILIVEDDAEQKVHSGRNGWLLFKKFLVACFNLCERRVVGRTYDVWIFFTLVSKFLIHPIVKIVEPSVGRFVIFEFARHEFYRAFSTESAREDVLLGYKHRFFTCMRKIFGGD